MAVSRGSSVTARDYNDAYDALRTFFTRIGRTMTSAKVTAGNTINADSFNRLATDYDTGQRGYAGGCSS